MDILLTGSVAYDYLMTFPGYFKEQILPERLASISLSFLVDSMSKQRGGMAPNIAYTMALLGERPHVMATVGEDFEEYRAWLEAKGVDTALMCVVPGLFTASFFATTDKASAQIATFYPGAMGQASTQSLKDLSFVPDLVIVSPNAPDAMMKFPPNAASWDTAICTIPASRSCASKGASWRVIWKARISCSAMITSLV